MISKERRRPFSSRTWAAEVSFPFWLQTRPRFAFADILVQPRFHGSVDLFVITNEIVIAALEHQEAERVLKLQERRGHIKGAVGQSVPVTSSVKHQNGRLSV